MLPGATVTITNAGTKAVQTASPTIVAATHSAGVFPGTYDLKVEARRLQDVRAEGHHHQPAATPAASTSSSRSGSRPRPSPSRHQTEVIQTETGAREGVLTAKQIDNLSVIGRSSLELLRILPGVVAPDQTAFESVSFGGGANNTQGYTVNGIRVIRQHRAARRLALIDIGTNSGVIVTLNNDMVQEVKVQSSTSRPSTAPAA